MAEDKFMEIKKCVLLLSFMCSMTTTAFAGNMNFRSSNKVNFENSDSSDDCGSISGNLGSISNDSFALSIEKCKTAADLAPFAQLDLFRNTDENIAYSSVNFDRMSCQSFSGALNSAEFGHNTKIVAKCIPTNPPLTTPGQFGLMPVDTLETTVIFGN
jgi:hypothetical protein